MLEPQQDPIHVALVDDHAVVRLGYQRLIDMEPGLAVVAEFGDAQTLIDHLDASPPLAVDVVLLDLSMPGLSGLDALKHLARHHPAVKVVVISMHDSSALRQQALRAGASAFVSKSDAPGLVIDALLRAARDEAALPQTALPYAPPLHDALTARETAVFMGLLEGSSVSAIAEQLGVSDKTVANVQTSVRQKLQVSTAMELLHYARLHHLLP